jgi:hypothetical protein
MYRIIWNQIKELAFLWQLNRYHGLNAQAGGMRGGDVFATTSMSHCAASNARKPPNAVIVGEKNACLFSSYEATSCLQGQCH